MRERRPGSRGGEERGRRKRRRRVRFFVCVSSPDLFSHQPLPTLPPPHTKKNSSYPACTRAGATPGPCAARTAPSRLLRASPRRRPRRTAAAASSSPRSRRSSGHVRPSSEPRASSRCRLRRCDCRTCATPATSPSGRRCGACCASSDETRRRSRRRLDPARSTSLRPRLSWGVRACSRRRACPSGSARAAAAGGGAWTRPTGPTSCRARSGGSPGRRSAAGRASAWR